MRRRDGCSCLRAVRGRYYTGDLILIVVVTGIVVLSTVGPHNVYTAFTTVRSSLASLLGVPEYDSADSTFLACTLAEPVSSHRNRIDSSQCKGFPEPPFGSYLTLNASADSAETYYGRYDQPVPFRRVVDEIDGKARKREASRTAIVLRAWDQFSWTDDDVRNVRSLISEVSLLGEDYSVYILLQIKDDVAPGQELETAKLRLIPGEFANITEAWTTLDSQNAYPAVGEHQFYYHAFMALQMFADRHQEFDYYWNWEMDVRFTGRYNSLFPSLSTWAEQQPDDGLWRRNTRFFMPSVHGSFDDFTKSTIASTADFPEASPWITDTFEGA
ncbi:hypothetical protein M409DRAFT_55151 [Zasmidium cellare ATCC 36951]|uniref:Uncharacterized protein n=1 Tax=Zasmidium cellare ATCC 36951 TaxID=1080233 RepID=A0A6A6CGD2_ZASCE|nr:uncharacterized protein M409DRAFT_55151 [Zasmidium cellare ATCC 36951]KAF2166307.1 hypothetical protein M409DRAFT_55151 [Zasmidium cellare ATCC 36951]